MEITILTVNYNTSHFIELMLFSFSKLTKRKWKMIICDNGSKPEDFLNLRKAVQNYQNAEIIVRQQGNDQPSIAHGKSIDLLISKADTSYFLLMDADCIFLRKYWDDDIINEMQKGGYTLLGTPAVFNIYKPIDFPEVYATMFDAQKYKELGSPTLCPDENWANSDNGNSLEQKDTGWLVRKECIRQNHKFYVFDGIYTKHNYIKSRYFPGIYCLEFFMKGTDEIMCSHFGRGSSEGKWKFDDMRSFIPKFLLRKRQISKWIRLSKKIIEKQSRLREPKPLIPLT
ncbi:MAG: glycosyltransferase [Elusimicrobiota bacterium]|jgi:hypothetical protein|nr:glycosyltransferase [Elusimicrobiota bacterium]